MPTVEFEVWCSCGNGLCSQTKETRGGIIVEPCEECLDTERNNGDVEGYDRGYNKGYEDCKMDNDL